MAGSSQGAKKSRALVPITARSSSGDRHLAPPGMTGPGTVIPVPQPLCGESPLPAEENIAYHAAVLGWLRGLEGFSQTERRKGFMTRNHESLHLVDHRRSEGLPRQGGRSGAARRLHTY